MDGASGPMIDEKGSVGREKVMRKKEVGEGSKVHKKKAGLQIEIKKSSLPVLLKKKKKSVLSSLLIKGKKDKRVAGVAVVKKIGVVVRAAPRVRG